MEASEKPQLPLDEAGSEPTVRALDGRIVIESLTVDDDRAAHLVRERQQLGKPAADTVRKAIEIGARVLDSEETAVNVDYVRRELEAGLGRLDQRLGGTIEDGAEAIAEQLATVFGVERNDSVQAQIREIVTAETRQQREDLLRALTTEDPANPLVGLQLRIGKKMVEVEERHRNEVELLREAHAKESRVMQQRLAEMNERLARVLEREEADERVAEAEAAGTRKGFGFEERVHAAIDRIAAARGDCATHTGSEASEGGGRMGDSVVEVGAAAGACQGRIVFEVKDKQGLSKQEAWRQLNGALDERSADFAVLVVAGEEQVPRGREQLHEYEGNKLIVAVDRDEPDALPLDVAYRLAAARVALRRDQELTVDAAGVQDEAEAAVAALKEAQKVRRAMTGAVTNINNARAGLDAMVGVVQTHLERIDALVAAASDAADEAE